MSGISTQFEAAAWEAPLALAWLLAALYQQHLRAGSCGVDTVAARCGGGHVCDPVRSCWAAVQNACTVTLTLDVVRASVAVLSCGDARRATTPTPTRGSSGHLRLLPSAAWAPALLAMARSGCARGCSGAELAMTEATARRRASIDCASDR